MTRFRLLMLALSKLKWGVVVGVLLLIASIIVPGALVVLPQVGGKNTCPPHKDNFPAFDALSLKSPTSNLRPPQAFHNRPVLLLIHEAITLLMSFNVLFNFAAAVLGSPGSVAGWGRWSLDVACSSFDSSFRQIISPPEQNPHFFTLVYPCQVCQGLLATSHSLPGPAS